MNEPKDPRGFKFKHKYKTDKFETGLMAIYLEHFQAMRNQPLQILEIGIGHCGATNFFAQYFSHPESKIIGLDIILTEEEIHDKITLIECDQNDSEKLLEVAEKYGPFDIIIDDGSHYYKETKNCYDNLRQFVKPGGYYVIEDFMAQYVGPAFDGILAYVLDLGNHAVFDGFQEFKIISDTNCSTALFRRNT